jgi:GT2 family glycosyltransferase
VEAISGACMMMRREVFERVGRFSEDYFMYVEDIDLSFQVRGAGYKNYLVPTATVIHHGGQSSQQAASVFSAVMIPEAISRFLRKTRGESYSLGYRVAMLASATTRLLILGTARLSGRRREAITASIAKWSAVLRWGFRRDEIVPRYYGNADTALP